MCRSKGIKSYVVTAIEDFRLSSGMISENKLEPVVFDSCLKSYCCWTDLVLWEFWF